MEIATKSASAQIKVAPLVKDSRNYFAAILLLLIIGGLFYFFFIKPKAAQLSVSRSNLTQVENDQADLVSSITQLKKMITDLKSHPAELVKLDEALPLESKSFRLNMLIDVLAKQSGVTLKDANFADKGDAIMAGNKEILAKPFGVTRTLQKMPGSIAVSGTYNNLANFITKIENNSRIFDIQNVEISSEGGLLNLRIDVITYNYTPS